MADDVPRYFLLRSGSHYIVAQAVVAVKQGTLPPAVTRAVNDAFKKARDRIEGVELPEPYDPCDPCADDDERAWVMLARMDAGMKKEGGTG